MALHTFNTNPSNSAGGAIATWAQGVSNGLRNAGLVRLNGSHAALATGPFAGASDFSALAAPGAINTQAAWEIWRFADTLQATFPVFIYVGYGSGALTTTPALWLGAGFALNNDVTPTALAGQVFSTTQVSGATSASAFNCMVSGTTARMCVGLWLEGNTIPVVIAVERTHNADGSDNDEGIWGFCVGGSAQSGQKHQVISRPTYGTNGEQFGFLAGVWPSSNVTVWGSDFHVTPLFPVRGRLLPPSRNIMGAKTSDVAPGATITLPLYGANRQWVACGNNWASNFGTSASASTYLLRYE
jgi:hypothetical protein